MQLLKTILVEGVRVLISLSVLGAAFGIVFWMISGRSNEKIVRPEMGVALVETAETTLNRDGLDIQVDGVAAPFREINVAAEVAGRIQFKSENCRAGRYVKEGEELVVIDASDYQIEVRRLQQEIAQAENSLAESDIEANNIGALVQLAQENLALQEREVDRVMRLFKQKAASEAEVDAALSARITAKNSKTQLENQLRLNGSKRRSLTAALELKKVQLERAELDLRRTRVTAPIDGVIVETAAEEDAYVARGAMLLKIEDTSQVEVRCQLKMDELYWLRRHAAQAAEPAESPPGSPSSQDYEIPNAAATVSYQLAGQTFQWNGRLSRFEGVGLDARTRTMPCRVVVTNPRAAIASGGQGDVSPPALVRGMFVEVVIHTPTETPFVEIPEEAMHPGNRVWVFEPDESIEFGVLREAPISVVRYLQSTALVRKTDRLGERTQVVITPLLAPLDGMRVKKKRDSAAEPSSSQPAPQADSGAQESAL